jgi:hypothetical protein
VTVARCQRAEWSPTNPSEVHLKEVLGYHYKVFYSFPRLQLPNSDDQRSCIPRDPICVESDPIAVDTEGSDANRFARYA